MRPGRRRSLCVLALSLAPGCDRLFGITHVPETPVDAATDAYIPCAATEVGTGQGHSCVIVPGGDVWCWGLNDYGQIQPGGAYRILMPVKAPVPGPVAHLSVGRSTTCVLLADQTVWCWGRNDHGTLGQGSASTSRALTQIQGIGPSAEVAVGGGHACSRSATDGTIWCWGRDNFGQTGQAATQTCQNSTGCTLPAAVPGTAGSKKVVAGHNQTCTIDAADHVVCWGRNNYGQLGDGTTTDHTTPMVLTGIGTVKALDSSGHNTCAVDTAGKTWCWGEGEQGEIGNGAYDAVRLPAQLSIGSAHDVSVAGFGSCALLADGHATCWGELDAGDGMPGAFANPRMSPVTGITQLASHYYSTCAIAGGGVLCWGDNTEGQLGRGERSLSLTLQPVTVPAGATQVVAGDTHACALTSSGISCWGRNAYAQAGDDTSFAEKTMPYPVSTPVTTPTNIVAAYNKTCAWGAGAAACWGRGFGGQLGTGGSGRAVKPTLVIRSAVQQVGIGGNYLCVLVSNGTVTCFGSNYSGQLGDGTTTDSMSGTSPVFSGSPLTGISQIATGGAHACAVSTLGALVCWGHNGDGQIGDGTTTDRNMAVPINTVGSVVKVAAGDRFTCSLNTIGELWCWGFNNNGQVGIGSRTGQPSPKKILTGVTDISVGNASACATLAGGAVSCWGNNDDGQIGLGTDSDVLSPTPIAAFANATSIALGDVITCVAQNGQVSCLGVRYALGIGDVSDSMPRPPMLPGCQ